MRQQLRQTKHSSGFTLIELMVVLAVVGFIVAAATPSMLSILASNRVAISANEIVSALNLAKSEAIRTNQTVTLCKSSNDITCTEESQWNEGWLIINNEADHIIRTHSEVDEQLGFNFRTANAIEFKPNGFSNINGRFCFKNNYDESNSRAVIIFRGRIRTEKRDAADDCAA